MLVEPTGAAPTAPPPLPLPARVPDPMVGPGTRAVIAGLLVLVAMRIEVFSGVSLGTAVGLAFAPVWLPHLRAFAGGRQFAAIAAVCLASGIWLTALASTDHTITDRYVVFWTALTVGLVTAVGVILWARTVFADGTVAMLFGIGMVAGISQTGLGMANPWKSALAMPLTVLLLGFAWMVRRRWLAVVLALLLAGFSAVNDSRSHFAMLLLATALAVWQMWFTGSRRKGSAWRAVVILAGLGWAVYSLGQALLLEGYLGEETQIRSEAQVEAAGNILLGGRPEIGATVALMTHRPWGLGVGTSATTEELLVAKAGMTQLGYDPNNGYVERYMFGELVELHSIIGDTWALFGIPGLALSTFIAWAMLRRAGTGLAARNLSVLMAVLVVRLVWDLLFGPLYSSLTLVALGVGLALRPRPWISRERRDLTPLTAREPVRSVAAGGGGH
ncbi:hypothetical protein [Cellulomonas sp. KRMCY2]|uniref:hypothetical protein n=1 Tax=Cellulomonas sp. KRMCY2 TaxID=1304865 RepID=UPI00045E867C|nr:hypothetical protein [Cellulomonas sp. KRMCY2]